MSTAPPSPLPGGLPQVERWRALSGGSIAAVWHAQLADGHEVVVKDGSTAADLEAEGLRALAAAGAPVPEVLAADGTVLVLEYLTGHRAIGASSARRWPGSTARSAIASAGTATT